MLLAVLLGFLASGAAPDPPSEAVQNYELLVLPAEHEHVEDEVTGAQLTYLTTDRAQDTNLYFHERSWLSDESIILFTSRREQGGLMGYLVETGELIRFATPEGGLGGATADAVRPVFYAVRGRTVLELAPHVETSNDPAVRSRATMSARTLCELPEGHRTSLNGNCDGTRLAIGIQGPATNEQPAILMIDVSTGEYEEVCRLPNPPGYGGHVQWSRDDRDLLSFAGRPQRLMVVNIRDRVPRNVYKAVENELVTHESWWVDSQLMFCGGVHPKPTEDSHVKLLNLDTGVVRIAGAGAWWEGAAPAQISKVNWWHATGSDDGRWIAADNWHGDIMLFEGRTTRPRLLTQGHRTYGKGEHPHVGWDRSGRAVVFASEKHGNADVCVARIPDVWWAENP